MQSCQWHGVKRFKSYFCEKREFCIKVWSTSLLPQIVLISSKNPISSRISLSLELSLFIGCSRVLPDHYGADRKTELKIY